MIKKIVFIFILLLFSWGCTTTSHLIGREELDENSEAEGSAFRVDAMHIRRLMPGHKDWRKNDFYYQHCQTNGDRSYYSKTSYLCQESF